MRRRGKGDTLNRGGGGANRHFGALARYGLRNDKGVGGCFFLELYQLDTLVSLL